MNKSMDTSLMELTFDREDRGSIRFTQIKWQKKR